MTAYQHTYKYRMAIASKGKGKSGGSRIITYNLHQTSDKLVISSFASLYIRPERPVSSQPRATPWVNIVCSLRPVRAKA